MQIDPVLVKICYEEKGSANTCQSLIRSLLKILSNPFQRVTLDAFKMNSKEIQTIDTFYLALEELFSRSPKIYPHKFDLKTYKEFLEYYR
jgi:hypothetical protein